MTWRRSARPSRRSPRSIVANLPASIAWRCAWPRRSRRPSRAVRRRGCDAKHLSRRRWVARLSSLASMQSLLHAERLRSEHHLLSQHAYPDDITRLGNRRALRRFIDGLVSQGVTAVALVLVDLDHFKDVNHSYGHSA